MVADGVDFDRTVAEVMPIEVDALPAASEHSADDHLDPLESWAEQDLGPVLRGELPIVTPTILRRDDGIALFYRARVNGIHADSGIGKSWIGDIAAAQELTAGRHVIWLDFEDEPNTIVERLRLLGVTDDAIATLLHYHRPTEVFSAGAVALILDEVREHDVDLVVIDSFGEAAGLEGLDENADKDTGAWFRRVARPIADAGPAVLVIDHATKAADNPLHPSGSKRKRAAITGASYLVEARAPLTREHGGRLRLTCAKDRHGYHRRGAEVASFEFGVYPDGGMTVHVWAPSPVSSDAKRLHVTRAAIEAVKGTDGAGVSGRWIIDRLKDVNVKAGRDAKAAAIEEAVRLGCLRTEPGARNALLHHYVHDLDEQP